MESEKKLRVTSLLGLKSARYGTVSHEINDLEELAVDVTEFTAFDQTELEEYYEFFDDDDEDLPILAEPQCALVMLSGFVSRKMARKLADCQDCMDMFPPDESVPDQYFENIDRGGLTLPGDLCFQLGRISSCVMQKLI